jgi:hypothetical protein
MVFIYRLMYYQSFYGYWQVYILAISCWQGGLIMKFVFTIIYHSLFIIGGTIGFIIGLNVPDFAAACLPGVIAICGIALVVLDILEYQSSRAVEDFINNARDKAVEECNETGDENNA